MQAPSWIAFGHGFDYASDLAAEFGGNTRGVHLHRLHILEVLGGGKCGRTVVENRQSSTTYCVSYSAPRGCKTPVRLKQPAGLCLHDVDRLPSRNRRCPVAQGDGAQLIGVTGIEWCP